jgi:hypothetical protein
MAAICRSGLGRSLRLFCALSAGAVLLSEGSIEAKPASRSSGELVIQWNQLLADTLRVPGIHPATIRSERSYSMLHVAMFDAINSIEQRYYPYLFTAKTAAGASAEAAAAQAAHDLLFALYPSQQPVYAEALAATLASIPPGPARQGREVGATIAADVLAWRSNDRWDAAPPSYVLPPLPGLWQPTGASAATFTHSPNVVPFAVESSTQFLPPPPPLITSAEYAEAFNEVKGLGAKVSAERTADQTLVALLHASVGTRANPQTVWNGVARDVSRSRALGLLETARLFTMLNVAFHDAILTSFTSKYYYHLWRPVTAIRRADEDSNPATEPDPVWEALLNSPPYPTYAGNAAALSAASARVLARFFGTNAIAFNVVFAGTGAESWTRSYSGFSEFADEQARSRIYGGIHFSFDSIASQRMAVGVADWVCDWFMTPR